MRSALAVLLAAGIALPAVAQYRPRGGGGTPGDFDFYVLALSWSPTFCNSEAGQRSRQQCGVEARAEFVVHGLWPQYQRGFPEYCGANRPVPRAAIDKAAAIYPDGGLARYQWNKHGTCSGLGPSEYFDDVAAARSKVVIPSEFSRPGAEIGTSPRQVERAFVEANRGLRADMISIQCRRRELTEVRICLSKDVRTFIPCPELGRSECRTQDIVMPVNR